MRQRRLKRGSTNHSTEVVFAPLLILLCSLLLSQPCLYHLGVHQRPLVVGSSPEDGDPLEGVGGDPRDLLVGLLPHFVLDLLQVLLGDLGLGEEAVDFRADELLSLGVFDPRLVLGHELLDQRLLELLSLPHGLLLGGITLPFLLLLHNIRDDGLCLLLLVGRGLRALSLVVAEQLVLGFCLLLARECLVDVDPRNDRLLQVLHF
mmetsp:Transcript_19572/g.64996  ORF Transcript_19572/g.64996 Transcript_19572/m.64996 type:complete len:205 (+) Transcript_19572:555-1169(+)